MDDNAQTALGVACFNGSTVQLYRAIGNGKAQTRAATGALPGLTDPIKRLENMFQLGFRNSRPLIADRKFSRIQLPAQGNLDRSSGWRVTDGVANHVLNGAPQ